MRPAWSTSIAGRSSPTCSGNSPPARHPLERDVQQAPLHLPGADTSSARRCSYGLDDVNDGMGAHRIPGRGRIRGPGGHGGCPRQLSSPTNPSRRASARPSPHSHESRGATIRITPFSMICNRRISRRRKTSPGHWRARLFVALDLAPAIATAADLVAPGVTTPRERARIIGGNPHPTVRLTGTSMSALVLAIPEIAPNREPSSSAVWRFCRLVTPYRATNDLDTVNRRRAGEPAQLQVLLASGAQPSGVSGVLLPTDAGGVQVDILKITDADLTPSTPTTRPTACTSYRTPGPPAVPPP